MYIRKYLVYLRINHNLFNLYLVSRSLTPIALKIPQANKPQKYLKVRNFTKKLVDV